MCGKTYELVIEWDDIDWSWRVQEKRNWPFRKIMRYWRSLLWWLGVGFLSALLAYVYYNGTRTKSAFVNRINATYDFVIVGGGTAGSVLANRLSENPDVSVLLLEAGGLDSDPHIRIPLLSALERKSEHDWMFYSSSQKYAFLSAKEKKGRYFKGRVLGGTSSINNMVYLRGGSANFNQWEKMGCAGWSFRDVVPYFLKAEDFQVNKFQTSPYHSKNGPLTVTESSDSIKILHETFRKATETMGYKNNDCNAKEYIGFCSSQSTINRAERVSASTAYLRPALDRKNLHVGTFCHVTKVLISNKKAVGVEYLQNGRKLTVGAHNDVILSAGSIASPHILLLSGVGPREHLEQFKIPVHADLPVGQFIQDHVVLPLRASINDSHGFTFPRSTSILANLRYKFFGTGPLSSNGAIAGHLFAEINRQNRTNKADVLFTLLGTLPEAWSGLDYNYESSIKRELKPVRNGKQNSTEGFTILIQPLNIHSNGSLHLRSTNPFDPPEIDPQYLHHQDDVNNMVQGIRFYYKMMKTAAFQQIQTRPPFLPFSKCSKHTINSDHYFECLVRHLAVAGNNLIGGCKMGSPRDNSTVVDFKLNVKGINNLRVIDSSVMPTVVSGDLYAPTIMLAEKAADIIKTSVTSKKSSNKRKSR